MIDCTEIAERAASRGFTSFISCSDGMSDLEGFIRPDADLDGTFTLICADDGAKLRVNGWLMCDCIVWAQGEDRDQSTIDDSAA